MESAPSLARHLQRSGLQLRARLGGRPKRWLAEAVADIGSTPSTCQLCCHPPPSRPPPPATAAAPEAALNHPRRGEGALAPFPPQRLPLLCVAPKLQQRCNKVHGISPPAQDLCHITPRRTSPPSAKQSAPCRPLESTTAAGLAAPEGAHATSPPPANRPWRQSLRRLDGAGESGKGARPSRGLKAQRGPVTARAWPRR